MVQITQGMLLSQAHYKLFPLGYLLGLGLFMEILIIFHTVSSYAEKRRHTFDIVGRTGRLGHVAFVWWCFCNVAICINIIETG